MAQRVILSTREAAQLLGISTRKLWELTNRGEVPHTRIGRRVLYSREKLLEWFESRSSDRRPGR